MLLTIPVEVEWTTKEGVRVKEHAETEAVSAHGAQLRMKSRLPLSGEVKLNHQRTGQSTRARVISVGNPAPDGLTRIAVEMESPGETFWGVSIPPPRGTPSR